MSITLCAAKQAVLGMRWRKDCSCKLLHTLADLGRRKGLPGRALALFRHRRDLPERSTDNYSANECILNLC